MYWDLIDGDCLVLVMGQYDSHYFLSIMEINIWFFLCVSRSGQSFAQNTWRDRDYLEELDIWQYNITMDL